MSVSIAGSLVQEKDKLYSRRLNDVGTVVRIQPHNVIVLFVKNNIKREVAVAAGGYVHGERDMYWNPPYEIDLPRDSTEKFKKVCDLLDVLVKVL